MMSADRQLYCVGGSGIGFPVDQYRSIPRIRLYEKVSYSNDTAVSTPFFVDRPGKEGDGEKKHDTERHHKTLQGSADSSCGYRFAEQGKPGVAIKGVCRPYPLWYRASLSEEHVRKSRP